MTCITSSRAGRAIPKGGMLCQDCHTTVDMHGDGNLPGTTLAQVEIECEDCHGTVSKFPWELPLGYGEEHGADVGDTPRGLADDLTDEQYFAEVYDAEDGYLVTARGNPFGNVVKKGSKVIMHSASGLDFEVPVLKQIAQDGTWKSPNAKVAMMSVGQHMESMECYACHADWAPQCYGCHITVDYSEGKTDIDWINNANARGEDGLTADNPLGTNGLTSAGKVSETRSYLRWEEPTLGINGEGRVSPLMPGCQVITTVIDKDGNTIVHNETWMTPDAGGTKGLDHAAVQPHTAGRLARSCESCHNNPKALGYGIGGGRFMKGYEKGFTVDLETAGGRDHPGQTQFSHSRFPRSTTISVPDRDPRRQAVGDRGLALAAHRPAAAGNARQDGAHRPVHGLPPEHDVRGFVVEGQFAQIRQQQGTPGRDGSGDPRPGGQEVRIVG